MRGAFLIFLGACSYGVLSTFAKLAYKEGYTPSQLSALQIITGALLLWCLSFFFNSRAASGLHLKDAVKGKNPLWFLLSGLCFACTGIAYYRCVQYVPASFAILLLFQFTWIGVLLESLDTKKFPSKIKIIALIMIFTGTFFAGNLSWGLESGYNSKGLIYGLISALSYSLFIFGNGKIDTKMSPVSRAAIIVTISVFVVLSLIFPYFLFDGSLNMQLFRLGLMMTLFGSVIPPLCYSAGLKETGPGLASVISSFELPVAVFCSYIILGEVIEFRQWAGIIIIIAAVALPNIKNRRSHRSP